MGDWSEIETNFNTADETINFGSRKYSGLDNLYETSTLAVIKNSGNEDIETCVNVGIHNGSVLFSLNNRMRIFDSLSCTNLSMSASFDHVVSAYCASLELEYLLLGLSNGTIQCLHFASEWNMLHEEAIFDIDNNTNEKFIKTFVEKETPLTSFLMVLQSGKVYRLSSKSASIEDKIIYTSDLLIDFKVELQHADFFYPLLVCVSTSGDIIISNVETKQFMIDEIDDAPLKKAFVGNKRLLVCLNQNGRLIQICTKTLARLFVKKSEMLFEDIILMQDPNCGTHILGITKRKETDKFNLQLFSYPELKTIFSLEMNEKIHLIKPESVYDQILYILEVWQGGVPFELRIQTVSETTSEARFQRLILRQKFEEAKEVARIFNLDLSDVRKGEAQMIVDKMRCDEDDINNLINILDTIDDDEFKIMCCCNVHESCSNLKDVEKVLLYCNEIDVNESMESSLSFFDFRKDTISSLLYRFNTYMKFVQAGCQIGTVQDWVDFSVCNLLTKLISALHEKNIEESLILSCSLDNEALSNLEEDYKIILIILNKLSEEDQLKFLNVFVPILLLRVPIALQCFINWVLNRVVDFELDVYDDFPENALNFLSKVSALLKLNCFADLVYHQQFVLDVAIVNNIKRTVDTLNKLQSLKNNYKVRISFQEFLEGMDTWIQPVLTMLSLQSQNELENFIQNFIMVGYHQPDNVLLKTIQEIIRYEEKYWVNIAPVILNYINSIDIKVEATFATMKAAEVPWCPVIRDLINNSLQYSHPLVEHIFTEIKYEPRYAMLKKGLYNLTTEHVKSHALFAAKHIIYNNKSSMIEDVYCICQEPKFKHEADVLLMSHFISKGDTSSALKILNGINSTRDIIKCCKRIICNAHICIVYNYTVHNIPDKTLEKNYYDIIEPVYRKIIDKFSGVESKHFESEMITLQNIFNIRKDFNENVAFQDLENKSLENPVLKKIIYELVADHTRTTNIEQLMNQSRKLGSYFQIEEELIMMEVGKNVGGTVCIYEVAKNLYDITNKTDVLLDTVSIILKYINTGNTFSGNSRTSTNGELVQQDNIGIQCLILARKLISKAIINSTESDMLKCLELGNWTESLYHVIHLPKTNCINLENYRSQSVLSSYTLFNAIRSFYNFNFILNEKSATLNENLHESCYNDLLDLCAEALIREIHKLQAIVHKLCAEGHHLIAYKLTETLRKELVLHPAFTKLLRDSLKVLLQESTKFLLQHTFATNIIDEDLASNLILACDLQYADQFLYDRLKLYKRNASKFEKIARIRLQFLKYNKITEGVLLCQNILSLSKWWKRVKSGQICYEEFFRCSSVHVLQNLIRFESISIADIDEFCLDFQLQPQLYHQEYLKNILMVWKPNYEIVVDAKGHKSVKVKNDQHELYESCQEVLAVINNKGVIEAILNNLWRKINYYHYEVFFCILQILSTTNNNQKGLLLDFLDNYRRVGQPGQTEIEEWYSLYPDVQAIDTLSEFRMPFTPTLFSNKIWNIIRPEMSLKTYKYWFSATGVLKYLTKDDVCSYAIKDIMSNEVFGPQSDCWLLYPKHKDLLTEIDECVRNISNLEQATSTTYLLLKYVPRGADLANAAAMCYKYAVQYKQLNEGSSEVQNAVLKIEKRYNSFSAMHILYTNKLAEKKYLDLSTQPVKDLIEALYMDERIVDKTIMKLNYADINKIVDELGELYKINVNEKRKAFVVNWLSSGANTEDFFGYVSVTDGINNDIQNLAYENLIRASYVCTSGNIDEWRLWLLQLGDIEGDDSKDYGLKAMALKCLCNITDKPIIEKLTETSYEVFVNFIHKLMLLNELERIGLCLIISKLDSYDKKELLASISNQANNKKIIRIMALICITYTIYEFNYWALILTQMLSFNMIRELRQCLHFLRSNHIFYNKKYYIDAWQAVVNAAFKCASGVDESEIRNKIIANIHELQVCPVVVLLDLEKATEYCFQLKQYDLSIVMVQYLRKEKRGFYVKEIIRLCPDVYSQVGKLSNFGLCGIAYIRKLLSEFEEE